MCHQLIRNMVSMSSFNEEKWQQSILDEDNDWALSRLKTWIVPQTHSYFNAPSGHQLHVRAVLPPGDEDGSTVEAVLLYCHGLNSHVNSSAYAGGFYPKLAGEGFAVFAVDIMGHGYSEGERSLIDDWNVVFEDLERFLEALMGVSKAASDDAEIHIDISAKALAHIRKLPVVITGVSMGGMIGMHIGLRLQRSATLSNRFKGGVFGCPALVVDLPPKPVQCLLRAFVVPLCSTREMPPVVSSSSKSRASDSYDLMDPKQRMAAEMDMRDCATRFPGHGLSWHQPMRWGTAGAFSTLYLQTDDHMSQVQFPFLLLHDPDDKVCFYAGSEKLMQLSPSKDKTLQPVSAGGKHSLPMVVQDLFITSMISWIKKRL